MIYKFCTGAIDSKRRVIRISRSMGIGFLPVFQEKQVKLFAIRHLIFTLVMLFFAYDRLGPLPVNPLS